MYGTTKAQRLEAAISDLLELSAEYAAQALTETYGCAQDDSEDFEYLAFLLRNTSPHAPEFARNMDTSPRESIPVIAWEFLGIRPMRDDEFQAQLESRCKEI